MKKERKEEPKKMKNSNFCGQVREYVFLNNNIHAKSERSDKSSKCNRHQYVNGWMNG